MLAQDATSQNKEVPIHLLRWIEAEIKELEKLRDILESEKQALGTHDAALIENTTKLKRAAVSGVEQASLQRGNYVRSLGINPLMEGWFDKIRSFATFENDLLERYEYLLSLTSRCRSLNQTNGLLINRREQLTSKVINILRANSSPEVYSGTGQSEPNSDTRILGKA